MMNQMQEERDFYPATEADWHNQWHFENPDKAVCPWDCGRNETFAEPEWFTVKCGHCKMYHGAPDWKQMRQSIRECSKHKR
jgi:hypothetical protein